MKLSSVRGEPDRQVKGDCVAHEDVRERSKTLFRPDWDREVAD